MQGTGVPCASEADHFQCHLADPTSPRFHPKGAESITQQSLQLAGKWVEPTPHALWTTPQARARALAGIRATAAAKRCPYGDPFAKEGCRSCRWCYSRNARVWLSDCTECAGYGTLR